MTEAVVIAIESKGDKAAILVMDDGTRVWTPEIDLAKPLGGKPIPADWTRKDGQYGPQALPPKQGKGNAPAAYRNTKEGFAAEQECRLRWQVVEEERRDRRTALMQAVALDSSQGKTRAFDQTLHEAGAFYDWLRATASSERQQSSARSGAKPDAARTTGKGSTASGTTSAGEARAGVEGDLAPIPAEAQPTSEVPGEVAAESGTSDRGVCLHPLEWRKTVQLTNGKTAEKCGVCLEWATELAT